MLGNNLSEQNLLIVPNAPPRYTNDDWNFNNSQKNRVSEDQQMLANRILRETERLVDESHFTTNGWKNEVDYCLKERINEISFLSDELKKQKKDAMSEEQSLKNFKQRLLNATEKLKEKSLKICQKCIILRENRLSVDMVNDEVDNELSREIVVIKGCQNLVGKTLEQTNEQIRRLRATIYLLDRDISNKSKSLQIDETNLSLRENQMDMKIYEGSKSLDVFNCTNREWEEITHQNTTNSAQEINSAKQMQSYIDIILKQIVEDLTNQINRTNEAFNKRISETRYVKNRLEDIHNETFRQVMEMRKNLTRLEKELAEMEGYLALTQMRLGNRCQRPSTELCKDTTQDTLMTELFNLRKTVGSLNQMLAESQASLRYLLNTQIQQEEEINIKTNTLKIDEVDCMTIREGLAFEAL